MFNFSFNIFSGTGCRTFNPGRWTYGWTSQFGSRRWDNFDDAWAACQSIGNDCGSILQGTGYYDIKVGKGLSTTFGGGNPNNLKGGWTAIADTRSTYCGSSNPEENSFIGFTVRFRYLP